MMCLNVCVSLSQTAGDQKALVVSGHDVFLASGSTWFNIVSEICDDLGPVLGVVI